MKRSIVTVFFLFFVCDAHAFIMQCAGDISFWAQENDKFNQIKLKPGQIFETDHNRTGVIYVGEYLKFPAVSVFPFYGITEKIVNKKIKYETDHESYFTVSYDTKSLKCLVKTEAAF